MAQGGTDAILTLFLIMGAGFLLKKTSIITKSGEQFMITLLQKAAIPALMFHSVQTQFTRSFLEENYPALLVAFLTILGSIIAGLVVSRLFRIRPANQGVFTVMFAFSNTILIGLPVVTGVFGEGAVPWLMLYNLMNSFLFWTLGIWLIGGDQGAKLLSQDSLKKLFNPAVLSFLAGIVLLYQGITVPQPVMEGFRWMRDLVTPLSTLYMGAVIADLSFRKLPGLKPTLLILFGRFVFSPLIALAILTFFGFSGEGVPVIVIVSALPVMTQVSVMAGYYHKDRQYAAFMTALTTLLTLLVIPVYLQLLKLIG